MYKTLIIAVVALTSTSAIKIKSDPICSSAGCTQYKHPKQETHDKDYFVADFGQDKDIIDHKIDLEVAEKIVGHHWKWDDSKRPKKI